MPTPQFLAIYRAMFTARLVDNHQLELVRRGDAFFHLSGAGHEASAALASHLIPADWLHLHYRDKALLILRGLSITRIFAASCCRAESPSRGRQLPDILSDREHNVLSSVTLVGNHALQAVGVAASICEQSANPIVVCSTGDGTTQEGEFLEAFAEAVRSQLPVLFLIENNGWAISTQTAQKTFFSRPDGEASEFYGLPIRRVDGSDTMSAYEAFGEVVTRMRMERNPALVVLSVARLENHSTSDDQRKYRSPEEIDAAWITADPVRILRQRMIEEGLPEAELREIEAEVTAAVLAAKEEALVGRQPTTVRVAKAPLPRDLTGRLASRQESLRVGRLTMREAIRDTLRHHLESDTRVFLYGQDIEDPKGDIFGVTQGLSTAFPGRVVNSPISEATIVGTCIGRALAGQRPVAFLQFADFLPLAYNQILSELGSMYWRTGGDWEAPVIVMIPCGAYRPGLGPFHSQSLEALAIHTPGVDVFMPSTAADAGGLLDAAFSSSRPTLFFYPKAALNVAEEIDRREVSFGAARITLAGRDITLVGWGNTVAICLRTADALRKIGVEAEVIDLQFLSPWDEDTVLCSVNRTGRLLVVHEDNVTCGMGAEVLAVVAQRAVRAVRCGRIARPDTLLPCNFANQHDLLPSFRSTLAAAADLLDLDLAWEEPPGEEDGSLVIVRALASGPSDDTVCILRLHVRPGSQVAAGAIVATIEASKSVFDMASPASGTVEAVYATEDQYIRINSPLLAVRPEQAVRFTSPFCEDLGLPRLSRRPAKSGVREVSRIDTPGPRLVGIAAIAALPASRLVTNDEILIRHQERTSAEVAHLTGIETRHWAGEGEDALTLAARASREALEASGLGIDSMGLIVCSTGSPPKTIPSLACQLLSELTADRPGLSIPAFDVNAACSGYLYALGLAHDYLQTRPHGRVLVVTSEIVSRSLDADDLDTLVLFGDAATATIVVGEEHLPEARYRLYPPELSAKDDRDHALVMPAGGGPIRMKGQLVFGEAVRSMVGGMQRACADIGVPIDRLAIVVPHQANQRILDSVRKQLPVPVFSNIRNIGNTSSSSIPLALQDCLPGLGSGQLIGLCAFGGGFTSGAAVLEVLPKVTSEAAVDRLGTLARSLSPERDLSGSTILSAAWSSAPDAPRRDPAIRRVIIIAYPTAEVASLNDAFRACGVTIELTNVEALPSLLALGSGLEDVRVVIAADNPAARTPDLSRLRSHLLTLTQTIRDVMNSSELRKASLFLLTRGACVTADLGHLNLEQAPLAGLAATLSVESPEVWGCHIDMSWAADDFRNAAEDVLAVSTETAVAYRGGQRLVRRLVSAALPAELAQPAFFPDAWYLITGGLGALGLALTEWIVSQGGRRVVLLSRKGLGGGETKSTREGRLRKMRESGAEIQVVATDIADREAVARVLEPFRDGGQRLRGVFHLAGVAEHRDAKEIEETHLDRVLRAKVDGSWNLHELTRDIPLDYFVNFSSISAVWGAKGLGSYAAANAFLDGLAAYRRGLGLPAISINWGPWCGGGMATDEMLDSLERMGLHGLDPDHALLTLGRLLASGSIGAVVARANWERFASLYGSRPNRRLLSLLNNVGQTAEPAGSGASPGTDSKHVLLLEKDVAAEFAGYLAAEVGEEGPLDKDLPLCELGIDSMAAADAACWVEARFHHRLPPGALLGEASINSVAKLITQGTKRVIQPSPTSASSSGIIRPAEIRSDCRNCFAVEIYRGGGFRDSPDIVATLKEIIAPSYEDFTAILNRELKYNDTLYLGIDSARKPCCFFMTAWQTLKLVDTTPLRVLYLGLSAAGQDTKGGGHIADLWWASRSDMMAWVRETGSQLVVWGTCATPSAYRAVAEMVNRLEPDLHGNYSSTGRAIAQTVCEHMGWHRHLTIHPFVLKGVAEATHYSAAERQRIAHITRGFTLLGRLGIEEPQGDRLLFVGFVDTGGT